MDTWGARLCRGLGRKREMETVNCWWIGWGNVEVARKWADGGTAVVCIEGEFLGL